eukprot:jgi/Phyca11/113933/e_gw1.25.434.1
MTAKKRTSYSLQFKLSVISEYKAGVDGSGFHALAKKHKQQVHDWVVTRNRKGLRVKDKYIQLHALNIHRAMMASIPEEERRDWLARFKDRNNLVSRRQTSTRTLPENASQICLDFIKNAQQLIEQHNIQPSNVINMDQVPRYFETEPKSTITTRGVREVLGKE